MDEERKDEREQGIIFEGSSEPVRTQPPAGSMQSEGPTGFVMRPAPEEQSQSEPVGMASAGGVGGEPPRGPEPPRPEVRFEEAPQGSEPPKKKKNPTVKKVIAVVLVVILGAGSGFGGAMAAMYYAPGLIPTAANPINISPNDSLSTGEAIAEKVIPDRKSVV